MVEPLAVGIHAAAKARIAPGDVAVVIGAGPIGMVTALAALAGGCSQVVIADVQTPKLELAATLSPAIVPSMSGAGPRRDRFAPDGRLGRGHRLRV
jgi:D-xylulose reductase